MENIYKITVLTNPDPRWAYPSERRYSASAVLGLGVVHLALAGTAVLLACLALAGNETGNNDFLYSANSSEFIQLTNNASNTTVQRQKTFLFNGNKSENTNIQNYSNIVKIIDNENFVLSTLSTLIPCVMCLGALGAGLAGLLAWKRWYIDHNIIWFFSMSILSVVTSTICLAMELFFILIENKFISISYNGSHFPSNSKYLININILIAATLEWIWSILSAKIAYIGMKSDYPDDIDISNSCNKIGKNIVNNVKNTPKIITPDILNHFPANEKIYKYFPKKRNNNLPKEESNSEYRDRVNKFLSSNGEISK